jgi:hypothetical protein
VKFIFPIDYTFIYFRFLFKSRYSGKQKKHTLKNQIVVMPSGKEIVDVVVGETGTTVDIKIWLKRRKEGNETQKFQGNKAYVGEAIIETPQKKTRNQDMTPAAQAGKPKESQKKNSSRAFN